MRSLLPLVTSTPPSDDGEQATGLDPAANASEEGKEILESLLEALPRIGIGVAIFLVAYIAVRLIRRFVRPLLERRKTESFARVMTKMISGVVLAFGFLFAVAAVFPSVKPVDLLAGLGIFSIAIGFAFQDILSNLLAGILLLIRQPFDAGDQIEVSGQKGTVQAITIRETQIKTFDGEKVIIPNAEVYQNVIRVQTAYGPKRTTIGIGLDDWEDLDNATSVITTALDGIDGIEPDPAVQVYFHEFGDSTTNLEVRYWTQPEQAEIRRVQDQAIRAIAAGLKNAGISMPSPITEVDARSSLVDALEPTD
ncbi:MAG: mechanosensitive ion channel family protein [Ilumatobacter sp.]|uniref:mechanosensitive ion channel family protein n=1 Tax=Ilumatobacter sp. TaxID=1967498 RepID=UPI003C706B56